MLREIVQAGHPVLRRPSEPVDPTWIATPEFNELVADMVETMHAAPGVGLAAPQIGLGIQLVVLEDRNEVIDRLDPEDRDERERYSVPLTVLVNPSLERVGRKTLDFYEGCLSISGWSAVTPRYERVRVKALNEHGQPVELDWRGWPARILQHEIDHLQGTLYIDRMETETFTSNTNLARLDELERAADGD